MAKEQNISFSAPKGTRDILPPDSWAWQKVTRFALDSFALAGYAPVETPMFEQTEVFERGVGATSEVVGKQMYTFTDQGDRSQTLRPEGTAPVMRAVLEHNLHRGPLPLKLSYAGAMFRQERPQKGRYRQFYQLGIEAIGSDQPAVDAEVIEVAMRFYAGIGLEVSLLLNSIGHVDESCRLGYAKVLVEFLRAHEGETSGSRSRSHRHEPDADLRLEGREHEERHEGRSLDHRAPVRLVPRALRRGQGAARRRRDLVRGGTPIGPRARLLHAHRLRVRGRRPGLAGRGRRRRPLRRSGRGARRSARAGDRLRSRSRPDHAVARR